MSDHPDGASDLVTRAHIARPRSELSVPAPDT